MKPQYTLNKQRITFDPDRLIVATFKGGLAYTGELSGLREWTKANDVDAVLSCTTEEGRHGLYPCLHALTPQMAIGLSVICGFRIDQNDGLTFARKEQVRSIARSMALAGIQIPKEAFQWGITNEPYANSRKIQPPVQMSLDAQLADSPFLR